MISSRQKIPVCLSIAGSDPGGGAGIQADLKTFSVLGVHGTTAIAAITAQHSGGVQATWFMSSEQLNSQLQAVTFDYCLSAIKVGMLGTVELAEEVAGFLSRLAIPAVIDPVFSSSTGSALSCADYLDRVRKVLIPRATVLTPNLSEAALLCQKSVDWVEQNPREACRMILDFGCASVVLKGGHGAGKFARDYLAINENWLFFDQLRLDTQHSHGTGCVFSAALCVFLAQGQSISSATEKAKHFVYEAISSARSIWDGYSDGSFYGPVDPLWLWKRGDK